MHKFESITLCINDRNMNYLRGWRGGEECVLLNEFNAWWLDEQIYLAYVFHLKNSFQLGVLSEKLLKFLDVWCAGNEDLIVNQANNAGALLLIKVIKIIKSSLCHRILNRNSVSCAASYKLFEAITTPLLQPKSTAQLFPSPFNDAVWKINSRNKKGSPSLWLIETKQMGFKSNVEQSYSMV